MAKILGDGQRRRPQAFAELQSYYLFNDNEVEYQGRSIVVGGAVGEANAATGWYCCW